MAKILVVEDNELNRKVILRRLQRQDYELLVASEGAEAIAMAREHLPDLILMDMHMPVLDGWEATKRLRAIPETADIPIIALTAHAMVGDREMILAVGCDEYETKPIDMKSLTGKIEALLTKAASRAQ